MSPCVGMGRDKWTITWYSFTHVNTLQVCMVQKTEKVIYSRTFTQGLNFTRSLFSVLLSIYILSQVTDIFLLMIANVYSYVCIFICCMPTVILLYWLILWFMNRSELTSIKGSINPRDNVIVDREITINKSNVSTVLLITTLDVNYCNTRALQIAGFQK